MFKAIMDKLSDKDKMQLINLLIEDLGKHETRIIDIENRGSSCDYVVKPLTYNVDTNEIYVEFEEVEREVKEDE